MQQLYNIVGWIRRNWTGLAIAISLIILCIACIVAYRTPDLSEDLAEMQRQNTQLQGQVTKYQALDSACTHNASLLRASLDSCAAKPTTEIVQGDKKVVNKPKYPRNRPK